jgi:dihydrofolate reductase
MRKIIMFNMVSLDGYFAAADGNIDWHVVDEEFDRMAAEMIMQFDTILFGRTTYQLFESYWPQALAAPDTSSDDRTVAQSIEDYKKIVVSKSLNEVAWNNSELWHGVHLPEIQKLKEQEGRDIVIYGSGTIVQALTNLGLIDQYKIMINPVILGAGKPLFANLNDQHSLKLLDSRTFASGNVLLTYERS